MGNKIFIVLLYSLLFAILPSQAQTPAIQWQKCLGGSSEDQGHSIRQTYDSGYVIAGNTYSVDGDVTLNHGNTDCWVLKLSKTGSILWQKSLGGSSSDYAYSIEQTTDSGYIVAGASRSINGDITNHHGLANNDDFWVVKLSSIGNVIWQNSLGGFGEDRAYSIFQTIDGGYAVTGWTTSTDSNVTGNHGGGDIWIVKLSSSGNIQWQKCLGGSALDVGKSILQTPDGGYILCGHTFSNDGDVSGNHGSADFWVVKLNDTGAIQWQKCLGGSNDDIAYSIQQTFEGGYIAAGYTLSTNGDVTGQHGASDYWVVKISSTGMFQWQKSLGGYGSDVAYSIQQTSDSGYILSGYTDSASGDVTGHIGNRPDRNYWIVKLSQSGNMQWGKCLSGSLTHLSFKDDEATCIQQTNDGGYIVTGFITSFGGEVSGFHGVWDIWVVKLSATTSVRILENNSSFSIFPNPTISSLTIISTENINTISISDLLGQTIYANLYNTLNVQIDVSNLSPGLYLIRINGTEVRKFVKE